MTRAVTDLEYAAASRRQKMTRPPRIWSFIMMAIVTGKIVYARSEPFYAYAPSLILPWMIGFIIAVDYVVRLARQPFGSNRSRAYWRWCATPAMVLLMAWALNSDALLKMRFDRNRASFNHAAAQLLLGQPSSRESLSQIQNDDGWLTFDHHKKLIGGYNVEQVSVFPNDRIVYFLTDGFFRGGWGFLYDPDGRAMGIRDIETRPLDSDWYLFHYEKP